VSDGATALVWLRSSVPWVYLVIGVVLLVGIINRIHAGRVARTRGEDRLADIRFQQAIGLAVLFVLLITLSGPSVIFLVDLVQSMGDGVR
jgi:hypothetical protein